MAFFRATNMASAMIHAAATVAKNEKVDHQAGTGNWIARRVALNLDREGLGIVREREVNIKLSKRTADKLSAAGYNIKGY